MKFLLTIVLFFFITSYQVSSQKSSDKKSAPSTPQNEFNKLQEMGGSRRSSFRDDYIWGVNTAFTTYSRSWDINILSPLRYGLNKRVELSSNILTCIVAPNIFAKYSIKKGERIWWASRHGFYFPTIALDKANKQEWLLQPNPLEKPPFIGVIRNELIASYPIKDKKNCNTTQPYIVISVIGSLDYGTSFTSWQATSLTKPWLEPRLSVLTGNGFNFRLSARVDYMYGKVFKFESELTGVNDNFKSIWAIENKTVAKYFLYQNLSVSLGALCSYSTVATTPQFGIVPFVDLSLYLGTKQNRMRGLWKNKMQ